jgi:hypothetical protein
MKIEPKGMKNVVIYLKAIYFMKVYPIEGQLKGKFGGNRKTNRKWVWYYVEKIQALLPEKFIGLQNGMMMMMNLMFQSFFALWMAPIARSKSPCILSGQRTQLITLTNSRKLYLTMKLHSLSL